ncbi:TIGR03564 family F420-dependent LLM class oxidoreductase [Pseudonocardia oroxyli]|uniref:F420-dependent oxidoreductase, MSMEG_4879 family n=1 Tax=Pseudonocardia oroxyli TaxID=366584 RepID=A0A1G8CDE3_PSEOR|nr:TIGR03564 family F420-dependent LLM class oxidoreductase [Pseudonocardia oroxyli]SDH42860.1 F420-dependent oxidoreductase, MSMEG_4879 family [Pseudonocardia oroxyli]
MTFGVALAASTDPAHTSNYVDAVVGLARDAAAAGLQTAWFGQRFDYDSTTLAALVGREVPQLTVGTSAIPIYGRHPLTVAAAAATAQAATAGRFRLGLALGAKPLVEDPYGIPYDRPIATLREYLTAIRPALATGRTRFRGELLTAVTPDLMGGTLPGATPAVPLLVAAMGPQALRAGGELADGILPFLAGPKVLGERIVPTLTAAAETAGRTTPKVVAFVPAVVTDDPDTVRTTAAQQMGFYDRIPSYAAVIAEEGVARAGDLALIGDERTILDGLRRYRDAGADEIVLAQTSLGGPAAQLRTWAVVGAS